MTAFCIGLVIIYIILGIWIAVSIRNASSDVELWGEEVE